MGRQDFCLTGEFKERGIRGLHGFMAEQVLEREVYCHKVPDALRAVGVLTEPLTIAEKALGEVTRIQDRLPWLSESSLVRGIAVVLGAGPVGLLGALALLVREFDTYVYSREPADSGKADWVRAVGAHYVSAADVSVAELERVTGRIDLIYEATGAAKLSFQALEVLGVNGLFIFTGVPGRKAPIELNADIIMRNLVLKNQLLYGSVNAGSNDYARAIEDLREFNHRWPTQLSALITHHHAPEEVPKLLTAGISSGIKHVVEFGAPR
jgi:glucose 1-dehydrogenase